MRYETVSLSLVFASVNAMLAALTARPAAALFLTMTVRLYKTDMAVSPGTVLADLHECDFNGYAAVTPASQVGPVNTPAPGRALLSSAAFVAGGALAPGGQVAYGYYLTDSAGPPTVLYGGERFASPVNFANPDDFLALDVYLPALFQVPTGLAP